MKTSPRLLAAFIVAATLAFGSLVAARAEETVNTLKFSDPDKPGTVKILLARGDIRLRGTGDAAVVVKSESRTTTPKTRKDGLRELTASSTFSLTEKDNVITVDATADGWGKSSNFDVSVPRQSAVIISNTWGGDIVCDGVTGDIEVKSMNGEIKLDGISGAALVETMNGEITATVRELREGKPLSFTSMNGEIVIRVPAEAKANVRLRSQNGSILTDFDEKALLTKTESLPRKNRSGGSSTSRGGSDDVRGEIHSAVKEAVRESLEVAREVVEAVREGVEEANGKTGRDTSPRPAPKVVLPPMTGGKIVSGTLNGGGPDIQVATMNGDVILRKADERK